MAKAVVHTSKTHNPFLLKAFSLKYGMANKREIGIFLDQLEAVSPYEGKEPSEMEDGVTYFAKGLRAYIWISYVEKHGTTRVGWDSGKVILVENNTNVVYYGPEIRRTENFYVRLEHWLYILKARVDNRPDCKHCGKPMSIMHGENGQYYWYCKSVWLVEDHPWVSERWDVGMKETLPEATYKFLMDKRERTRKYNKLRLKQNKPKHGTARKRKKTW